MIEPKDLENVKKICEELVEMGFDRPRVTIFRITSEKSEVSLSFSKTSPQTAGEEAKK